MDDEGNRRKNLEIRMDALRRRLGEHVEWRSQRQAAFEQPYTYVAELPPPSASLSTHRWHLAGWSIIGVFFLGSIAWASAARVDGAAIALGTVAVESSRKSVAHLEGGIVREILVHEGQRIRRGDVLVRMDATRAEASMGLLQNRLDTLQVKLARLSAERRKLPSVEFPAPLLDRAGEAKLVDLMDGEMQVFETRRNNLARQDRILQERIAKQRAEIRGFEAKSGAEVKRLALLKEERGMMRGLVDDGLIAKNRLLSVERSVVEAEGEVLDIAARIAQSRDEISKLEMERALAQEQSQQETAVSFQETQERITETAERLRAAEDISNRTDVLAPTDGIVVQLRHHTIGGVVQAGEPILEIVPDNDRIVIDLRIDPNDIDIVYPGQMARVRLTAFSARTTPMIDGEVVQISADRIVDPKTGAGYFSGRVVPSADAAPGFPALQPGMLAEVFLVTGERTVLDYILDPLTRSLDRAGRES